MLAYLDALCTALVARDASEIRRLLRHTLARALPRRVREEAHAVLRAGPDNMMAPVHALHLYHTYLQLVLESPEEGAADDRPAAGAQLELPLVPDPAAMPIDVTIARARRFPREVRTAAARQTRRRTA